jgi:hypothetical protein
MVICSSIPSAEARMGRTVLPFSQVLAAEFQSWKGFRRTLDREGRAAFDQLFAAAKFHQPAMVYASRLIPLEAILMGILVEHQKALARLQEAAQRLETWTIPPPAPLPPDSPV